MNFALLLLLFLLLGVLFLFTCLQCFKTISWASRRASSL